MLDNKVDLGMKQRGVVRILLLFAFAFLGGCASSVVVKPDIPSPLVQKLPLKAGLVYTDTFKDYVYFENEKKRGSLKSIDFTVAQTTMFDQIFGALTNLVSPTDPSRDLSIEPQILDFQYSAPSETKLKQYEIWIKYRLKLRNADDASIADWTIKGYGKTPTGLLTTASSAFNAATNVALRDVGAQLATRFSRQRVVKTLLDGGTPRVIPERKPEPVIVARAETGDEVEAAELPDKEVSAESEPEDQPTFEQDNTEDTPNATQDGENTNEKGGSDET